MVQEKRLVAHFMELVQIDSETGQEREICDYLIRQFAALGLAANEDNTAAITGHSSGNLLVHLAATPGCETIPGLLFTCHFDTVVPGKGVRPQLVDGVLCSDGTTILGSDDKAGIAALFEAIRVLAEQKMPHGPIQLILTAGEESGLLGARALDPATINAQYGFALDCNEAVGGIVIAAPYQARLEAEITGRTAHAGVNPEDGISAIQVASKAISRMRLGRIDHETSANIGSFEGTGPTNIVCDRVLIKAEARSINEQKFTLQVEAMCRAFEETAASFGAQASVRVEQTPGFTHPVDAPVVKLAAAAAERIGRKPRPFHSGGGSDANLFNSYGLPCLNLSIGYERIHTVRERLAVEELVKTAELVVALVEAQRIGHQGV